MLSQIRMGEGSLVARMERSGMRDERALTGLSVTPDVTPAFFVTPVVGHSN